MRRNGREPTSAVNTANIASATKKWIEKDKGGASVPRPGSPTVGPTVAAPDVDFNPKSPQEPATSHVFRSTPCAQSERSKPALTRHERKYSKWPSPANAPADTDGTPLSRAYRNPNDHNTHESLCEPNRNCQATSSLRNFCRADGDCNCRATRSVQVQSD
jgi:hypothetical protein